MIFITRKKHSITKLFAMIFLMIFSIVNAQNLDYELVYFDNSNFYYNSIIVQNEIFLGSNNGVFKLKGSELDLHDPKFKGPIKNQLNKIASGQVLVSDSFRELLPASMQSDLLNSTSYGDDLILISNGLLFVFRKNFYSKQSVGSVRSISKNFIGTYSGVFRKDDKSKIIGYTNSYIREFDDATFICWDGLLYLKDSVIKNFNNPLVSGISIRNNNYGIANDILEFNHPNYLLSTDKGLFSLNVEDEDVQMISDTFNDVNFANYPKFIDNKFLPFILFSFKESIYSLDKTSMKVSVLHTFNHTIESFLYGSAEAMFILFKDRLIQFNPSTGRKKVVMEELVNVNDVGIFKNFVFVTTDSGLQLYDNSSGLIARNIIRSEFNKKAVFIDDDQLFLGGVSGIFSIKIADLTNAFLLAVGQTDKAKNIFSVPVDKLKWPLLILIMAALVLTNIFFYRKYRSVSLKSSEQLLVNETKYEIEQFIDENISSVNLEMLKSQFDLSNYALYNIMDKRNPGEIIRRKRLSLVKTLRKQNMAESEISKQTGFSISYLKKI